MTSSCQRWFISWHRVSWQTFFQSMKHMGLYQRISIVWLLWSKFHISMFYSVLYHSPDTYQYSMYPLNRVYPIYSEGSFVRSFFSPKPFEVAMLRRTRGPKVLYSEVHLVRRLLCSEDSIFRKALHYMDSMLRSFFSPMGAFFRRFRIPKIAPPLYVFYITEVL